MTQHFKKQTETGEDIQQYLSEIRAIPLLTQEEEKNLARRCASGDEEAIRRMVNANLRLVTAIAREYAGRGVPLLDLIQEGSIGLLAAARKFDYTLDYRFSTYATKWIRQGVTRCLLNNERLIRVPLNTAEKIRKVEAVRSQLRQKLEQEPTAEQIAAQMELPVEKVQQLLRISPEVCSLDVPADENEKNTLGDILEDMEALQPQEALVRQELVETLEKLLSALTERQQMVLRLHFGLEDGTDHSLEDIGKMLGISKERARQIEHRAIERLQELGTSMGLEDFLE